MRIPGLHPTWRTLNRYVDRTLETPQMRRVSTHIIGCRTCRADVERVQALTKDVRAIDTPSATPAMLERIVARRAAVERMILPTHNVERKPNRGMVRIAVAAAVIATVATFAQWNTRTATAANEDGELVFNSATPKAGDTVAATYTPSQRFTGDTTLFLRSRTFYSADDLPPGLDTSPRVLERRAMRRGPDDKFRLSLVLPPNAIYATFVIEDPAGVRIDANHGQRWELLTYTNVHPDFNSLLAATHVRRSWDARNQAAHELVELYPDSIQSWKLLGFTEDVARGAKDTTVLVRYSRAFKRFDSLERRQPHIAASTLETLAWMARFTSDSAHRAYWLTRLLAEAPHSRTAVMERAVHAIEQYRPDATALARALPALERIWQDAGATDPSHITFGLQSAIAAQNPAAIARWGRRYIAMNAGSASSVSWVGRELSRFPVSRNDGLALLRSLLAPIDVVHDPERRLSISVHERRAELDDLRAETLQYIGEALLADGKPATALDSLRLAVQSGWNPVRFDAVARAALRAGDTATSARMLALLSTDPASSSHFADSARHALGASITDSVWKALVASAREEAQMRVLAGSVRIPIHADRIDILDSAGRRTTFAKLAGGHVVVVAFGMDVRRNTSPVDRAEMQELAHDLSAQNARIITFAIDRYAVDLSPRLRTPGQGYTIAFDEFRNADRAFEAYGFPVYYVVDETGTIRFAYSNVRDLRLQVLALKNASQALSAH